MLQHIPDGFRTGYRPGQGSKPWAQRFQALQDFRIGETGFFRIADAVVRHAVQRIEWLVFAVILVFNMVSVAFAYPHDTFLLYRQYIMREKILQ